ncbi:cytochrome b5 domain-containing protein [Micropruina sonneratiae]|uniref:cytochrome b5 domain-containing protein n=1 Tax=Micropruina sonneratiae TaxID=2986940 RepID=UPI002226456C|nr:cytochrome b5 domain-containing protein [Micropruina sp. KQZ13P-5]MCW3158413.1 hypothetical protein [Micropruina sp. KQZ13P-5]
MFDVFGLPLHPLVVHAVVVLLPLSALGVIACAFIGRLRRRFAGLAVLGLLVGTVSAFVAVQSGLALAQEVGTPAQHMSYGTWLPWASGGTLLVAGVWYFLQRGRAEQATASRVMGWLAAALSVGCIVLTVLVGHSGAVAVWGGSGASGTRPSGPAASVPAGASPSGATSGASTTPSAGASPTATATESAAQSYTLDEVKEHNSTTSCWAAIRGGVYDLTDWINQHPGGPEHIVALCGTDATAAFDAQHSGQGRPESQLTQFYIGELKS